MSVQWPLSILIYHRVTATPDRLFPDQVDARRFERQLRLLKRWFRLLPLSEAVRRLGGRRLRPRAACLTLDDGYADNAAVVLPILQRHGVPAAFLIASGYLDGGCMWNDAVIEVVRNAPGERLERVRRMVYRFSPTMLSSDQLIALHRADMEIGARTVSHPILTSASNAQARAEIVDCRARLQKIIHHEVSMFAYPNGKPGQDFEERHAAMLRAQGFEAAVTTAWGAARPSTDPFYLPRFTPWDRGSAGFLLRMARNMMTAPA